MRALLDVNVWVALFDDAHQFSPQANAFIATPGVQVATCPLTENGVVRSELWGQVSPVSSTELWRQSLVSPSTTQRAGIK